jgi:hypothetical protein
VSRVVRTLRRTALALLVAFAASPAGLWAQATEPLSSQRLGRPYLFMFIAYAIVLGLIATYVISIAVRLARVEKRLQAE